MLKTLSFSNGSAAQNHFGKERDNILQSKIENVFSEFVGKNIFFKLNS